ncbi:MAG: RNA polymerase sigma factor [Ginsengibacter sp.]
MLTEQSYNEQKLIQLVAQSDEIAFGQLFDHYRNKIYTVALNLTHSTTVAEEIVEDVFLKVWSKRSTLNEIGNFNAYIYVIARNETYKVLKQIGKNYKVVLLAEMDASLIDNRTDEYLISKEMTSLLQKAIDRLPHQQKQVYKLIKDGDLKRGEVAKLLQIQPETVKFHLAQAMKNIRAYCMLHLSSSLGLMFFLSHLFEDSK